MAKEKSDKTLAYKDLEKVKEIWEKGKLDEILSNLNPNDVKGTLKRVPKQIIRLMSALLVIKEPEKQVSTLKKEERMPVEALIKTARKNKGEEFTKRFIELATENQDIRREFKLSFRKFKDPLEAKIDNSVSNVYTTSQLMLKSNRLYTEVCFLWNEEIRFRFNPELDELLNIVVQMMAGARNTLYYFLNNTKEKTSRTNIDSCKDFLSEIDNHRQSILKLINQVDTGRKTPKRRKRIKSKVTTTKKTKTKR